MVTETSVLYIDDDIDLSELVEEYLTAKGIGIQLCHDPTKVVDMLLTGQFDLCLMDVKMPEKDGFSLAEDMVEKGIQVPFLFLTGQTRKEDRIRGLKLGAEDFITKPFSLEELYLRIKNITKRGRAGLTKPSTEFKLDPFVFHADYMELRNGDIKINLSTTEGKLLHLLCENVNQVVDRKNILIHVWGDDDYYKGLSLNVYITRLRKLLNPSPKVSLINEHGQGYKLVVS